MSLTATPKRRNRARKPSWSYAGLSLDQWQADSARVRWAQTDANFNALLTVLINARVPGHCTNQAGNHSESYHLGYVRGYEAAIGVVQQMARGALPPASPMGEPDYPEPPNP